MPLLYALVIDVEFRTGKISISTQSGTLNLFMESTHLLYIFSLFTPKDKYELIVVDNNSSDGTASWIKEQSDITGIYNQKDAGFSEGYNQGIEISKGKSILLLSNETILTPNWLNNLDKALYSSENIGAVGPVSNNMKNSNNIKIKYSQLDHMIKNTRLSK